MAAVIIRPISDSSMMNFTTYPVEGQACYAQIDESVLDAGDYILARGDNQSSSVKFTYSNTGLSDVAINSITMHIVTNTSSVTARDFYSGNNTRVAFSGTAPNFTCQLTTNPDTGYAWTLAEIENLVAGIYIVSTSKGYPSVQQLYIEVDYTEEGGDSGTTHEGEVALSSLSYLRTKKA